MSCPKNPKKWLVFNYEGPHKITSVRVSEWAFGKWEVTGYCDLCGDKFNQFGINPSELIRVGLEAKEGTYLIQAEGNIVERGW